MTFVITYTGVTVTFATSGRKYKTLILGDVNDDETNDTDSSHTFEIDYNGNYFLADQCAIKYKSYAFPVIGCGARYLVDLASFTAMRKYKGDITAPAIADAMFNIYDSYQTSIEYAQNNKDNCTAAMAAVINELLGANHWTCKKNDSGEWSKGREDEKLFLDRHIVRRSGWAG